VAAFARLDAAETLASRIAELDRDLAARSVTTKDVDTLVELQGRVAQAKAAMDAGAPTLEVQLEPAAMGKVTADGEPLEPGHRPILGPLTIAVEHIGTFTVSPASSAGTAAQTTHHRALDDLTAALQRLGVETLQQAREAAEARSHLAADFGALRVRLEAVCPPDAVLGISAGLIALRGALMGAARPDPGLEDHDPSAGARAAEQRAQAARMSERAASEARDAAARALQSAELQAQTLAAASRAAQVRFDQARDALAQARGLQADLVLEAEAQSTLETEARAKVAADEATATAGAFSVEDLERRLANADTRRRNLELERIRLAGEIGRLGEAARAQGEAGPAADVEIAAEALESVQSDVGRLTEEADVLSLLRQTLADATRDSTRLYLGPVTNRVAPYVERLLPGATLELSDVMAASSVNRAGRVEPAGDLSRGTQEQLAVLTRIAFADLLLDKGRPVSLILDDALVYSDDGRLETMTDIISEVAGRMQVIMLTCRKRAFLHLEATRLPLRAD
jgi:uncharacterized protein YhaN